MKINKKNNLNSSPDMLPLMDCMFILLIYFIFSMMMMIINVNIPMSLPKQELEDNDKVIYAIEIKDNDQYYWNKQTILIDYNLLKSNINNVINSGFIPPVFITTDKDVAYSSFIKVLDLLRELNISNIVLDTGLSEYESSLIQTVEEINVE